METLEAGIFEPHSVSNLLIKMNSGKAYSEIDNMALTAIISTQLLYKRFIKEFKYLEKEDLINCTLRSEENYQS